MDASTRSHRRAVWLIVALLLTYAVGLVGYEMNWIHQRRVARARWLVRISPTLSMGDLSRSLPARGVGPLDKLVMRLVHVPEMESFFALYPGCEPELLAKLNDKNCPEDILESLAVVRHARWLFPEAAVAVEYPAWPAVPSGDQQAAP
jgi:hypothetical protein